MGIPALELMFSRTQCFPWLDVGVYRPEAVVGTGPGAGLPSKGSSSAEMDSAQQHHSAVSTGRGGLHHLSVMPSEPEG